MCTVWILCVSIPNLNINPLIIVHIMFTCPQEAKFMDEVDGIEVVHSPKREEIQEICQKMCSWER